MAHDIAFDLSVDIESKVPIALLAREGERPNLIDRLLQFAVEHRWGAATNEERPRPSSNSAPVTVSMSSTQVLLRAPHSIERSSS